MTRSTTLALAAAIGAGLFTGAANAQDLRAFDDAQSARVSNEDAVRMRFTLPFSQAATDRQDARVSFGFAHDFGGGQMGALDLLSFSLAGDTPRLETPLTLNANGDGSAWYASPTNWLLIGAGVAVAWAIYENNEDDNDPAPVGPT